MFTNISIIWGIKTILIFGCSWWVINLTTLWQKVVQGIINALNKKKANNNNNNNEKKPIKKANTAYNFEKKIIYEDKY